MARKSNQDFEAVGSDSFLDVVANIVGILIILVTLVGLRTGQSMTQRNAAAEAAQQAKTPEPVAPSVEPKVAAAQEKLLNDHEGAEARARSLQTEVLEIDRKIKDVEVESEVRKLERHEAGVAAEMLRREIEGIRSRLSARQQHEFEQERKLNAAQTELLRAQSAIDQAAAVKPDTVKLVNYPTPISQTVHGDESHFQLSGGRVAFVPIERLLEKLRGEAQQLLPKFRQQNEVTGSIGPIYDFRMRYTFRRVDVPAEVSGRGHASRVVNGGSFIQLTEFKMVPERLAMGEPLEDALKNTSEFRTQLAAYDPARTTVTLWIYQDSFEAFRAMRQELYRLGYNVAGRPLAAGMPISGSPRGTRSSAQ